MSCSPSSEAGTPNKSSNDGWIAGLRFVVVRGLLAGVVGDLGVRGAFGATGAFGVDTRLRVNWVFTLFSILSLLFRDASTSLRY